MIGARARAIGIAIALAIVGTACATTIDPATPQEADRMTIPVPPTLAGLKVSLSNKATRRMNTEAAESDAYMRDAQVFALRHNGELRAVYQVIRLTPDARTDDFDFRRTIAGAIGGSRAPENHGGVAVYIATQNEQLIHTWFEDKFMQVLIVRDSETIEGEDPGFDKAQLLAEALALEPVPIERVTG